MISASAGFKSAADDPQRITEKQFIFNGTNHSARINVIDPIDLRFFEGENIDAIPLSIVLINDDGSLNSIKTNKAANFNEAGAVSVGFDAEFVTLYAGKLDGFESEIEERHVAVLRFVHKLKACFETGLGSTAFPLDYSAQAYNPADLAWALLTVRGGLDATASVANTDIDYSFWSEYKSICADLGFSLRAKFTGQTIAEALRLIGWLTDSLIYPDPTGKVYHRKFVPHDASSPYHFTEANAHLEKPRIWLNRDRIINKIKAWYGYNPSNQTWAGSVTKENTTSQTDYGLLGREADDTSVWHDNSTSAGAWGERLVARYFEPAETIEFGTRRGSQALLHQVGDAIQVTCTKQALAAKGMQIYGINQEAMTQVGSIVAEDLGALNGNFLILDSATNGDPDVNVLY